MKNIQISNDTARRVYPDAVPELKESLENAFGKEFFSQKITDRLKSVQDACEMLGTDLASCTPYPNPGSDRQIAVNNFELAVLAVQAINEGWRPDWNNRNEPKYQIWWNMEGGFRLLDVNLSYRDTRAGSRLCFRSRELAEWAGKQSWFVEICKKFMVIG